MGDRTFPPFHGAFVTLGHRLRRHRVTSKRTMMYQHGREPRPARIYDCQCGRAWVAYD